MSEDVELRAMRDRLHERMKAVHGDGFGVAGNLIGAYKRTVNRLDEAIALAEELAALPPSPRKGAAPDSGDNCPACGRPNCPYDWRVVIDVLLSR
jgi:hypothetical protein